MPAKNVAGAVLLTNGRRRGRVVAFIPTIPFLQQNYWVIQRELLAVVSKLLQTQYLRLEVHAAHRSSFPYLAVQTNMTNRPSSHVAEFDVQLEHWASTKHSNANGLS